MVYSSHINGYKWLTSDKKTKDFILKNRPHVDKKTLAILANKSVSRVLCVHNHWSHPSWIGVGLAKAVTKAVFNFFLNVIKNLLSYKME